jgi:predicted acetyltransferase
VYNNVPLAWSDFAAFVRELEDEKRGIGLPPGIVSQTTYALVRDGERVLGEFRFRPNVPPPYFNNNGHVGYNVWPSGAKVMQAMRWGCCATKSGIWAWKT